MSTSSNGRLGPVFAAVLALLLTGCGLTAPRGSDGFANLDSLGMGDTDRVFSLSLGPAVLNFAAAHVDDDPETQELLRSLDGIRIRIYEVDGDPLRVAARMTRMSDRLQADGWEPVMLVRQPDQQAHMLLRMIDGRIRGMTVLVLDGDTEAVVINLMGDIQPDQFGEVMVAMDVDSPGVEPAQPAHGAGG
mgnify:FL=1